MTPRLQIAAMIFQGMVTNPNNSEAPVDWLLTASIINADALIEQEKATRKSVEPPKEDGQGICDACDICFGSGKVDGISGRVTCGRCYGTGVDR